MAVFENRTGEASLEPLGRTIADRIVDGLTRIEGLEIVPGSRRLRSRSGRSEEAESVEDAAQSLARDTGAGLVVSGVYALADGDITVQTRLTDATSGQRLSPDPAVGPRDTPMVAVEGARDRILGAVAVKTDPDWLGGAGAPPPTYEGYREYRAFLETTDDPRPHLLRALELDPDFALPRIELVGLSFVIGDYAEAGRQVAILKGREARLTPSQRLVVNAYAAWLAGHTGEAYLITRDIRKLEPTTPGAAFLSSWFAQNAGRFREAVGILTDSLDWERFCGHSRRLAFSYFFNLTVMLHELGEHERELAEVRRGEALHPEVSWLLEQEAYALAALGRFPEMERAIGDRLALASAGQRGHLLLQVGREMRAHGHPKEAAAVLERSLEAFRGCSLEESREQSTRSELALLHLLAGRYDESRALYEELAGETPVDREPALVWAGDRGVVAAASGRRGEARHIQAELGRTERPYLFGVHTYERARIAAALGERDEAVDLLRTAYAQGFMLSFESNGVHLEPAFESLRGYSPFEEVVRPR